MSVNFAQILGRGGKSQLDLLSFAVFSVRPDGLFVYLVGEYRLRPTAVAAVALYDLFCAPNAPARLSAESWIPPKDPSLAAAIAPVRFGLELSLAPPPEPLPDDPPWEPPARPLPANYLYGGLADRLMNDPDGQIAELAAEYDPDRGPIGSLPGGKLSGGQRAFADTVWKRQVRPTLVAAGFWRMSTVGQT